MLDTRIILSGLWVVVVLIYKMGDIYRIIFGDFKKMGGDFAGKMGDMQVTQGMMLGIAIFMVIPIVMVFLSLTLPYPVNRWANIIVAIIFFVFVLIQLPTYPSAYDKFLLAVSLVFNALTFWYAWKWVA
jgi:hypothetical protein